ncbi:hypothetical protein PIB30_092001 [Stylosanthes scabra]|uniref:Uncharacterized protein n=1 Tax=Stylosanthes scabra TaxID=79078 RepID=A0ABU6ZTC1_9FABA|nr:hypothetical protein [Stylosanthes scabra]
MPTEAKIDNTGQIQRRSIVAKGNYRQMHTPIAASTDIYTAHVEIHVEASLAAVRVVGREVLAEALHPPRFAMLCQPTLDVDFTRPLGAGTFIRCSPESPLSLVDGVWNVLKEVSQGATKIPSRTRVFLLRKRKEKCCLEYVSQLPAPRVTRCYPAVTGSDLLSPGSQALVPCCRGEPRTMLELTYAYAWRLHMRTHRCRDQQLGVPPTLRCVRMAPCDAYDRLQQWPSRFCCDPSVPFALFGHFRSELRLLYPETFKPTHQGIVRNGRQFKAQQLLSEIADITITALRNY